jgi:uncharacterized protein
MIFAAVIEYIQDTAKIAEIRPAHRVYLGELLAAGKLVAAGPFLDDFGALIVYEADTAAAVESLITADPFHAAGVFVRWTVRPWKVVFANPELMPKS